MANNITVKDASSNNIVIHTVEDSTSAHYNMSIPITTSGGLMFDQIPGNVSITNATLNVSVASGSITATIADNAPVSVHGGVLGAVSLGGGSANIGTVSISPTQANIPVSIAGTPTVNAAQSGTWNTNASVVGRVSVFVDQVPFNVSINNSLPVLVSLNGTPAVSVANTLNVNTHAVTQSGTWNIGAITSINDDVSIANQTLFVHVCNSLPAAGATQLVSIGGAVSLQAVQIAGRDINGDARTPRTHTDGALLVHVCNAQAAPSSDVSVSPTQGSIPVSIAGGSLSIADNAPVSVRGGRVSIADSTLAVTQSGTFTVQPGNTANTTPWLVSVNGQVSLAAGVDKRVIGAVSVADATLGVTQSGTWNTNASVVGRVSVFVDQVPFNVSINNTLPIPVSIVGGAISFADNAPVSVRGGRVSIADSTLAVTQSGTWGVGVNAGTNLIGAVSIRQIVSVVPDGTGANFPVSIAGTPTVNAAQSGTFTVQPGNTANTTPWLVSIGGNVSLTDNAPVSVRGGVLGAVSLGGGTAQVGRVSVFVDQVPFNVSINNSLPIPVSVVGGRVSIQGISQVSVAGAVTVSPLTNTGAAVPAGAFMVGGTDGTNLRALLVDALGALKVTGFVTNSEASFTRATDTVTYAAGDLVANTTVAGTVTPMTFAVSRFATGGGSIMIRRAKIVKSDGDLTNAQFRVHLYNTSNGVTNQGVSVAGGDNTGYVATQVSNYLGFLSVTCQTSHSNGAVGWGGPNEGMEMNAVLGATQFGIQGLLEVRAAYVPSSGERFNVTLEVYQD